MPGKVKKAAAIDIGSNAIRLLVGGLDQHQHLQFFRKERESVRLGQDVFENGRHISIDAIAKTLKAFEHMQGIIREQNVKSVRAVATSAVRDAVNGKAFIDIIYKATGIPITIITGVQEAKLIQKAIDHCVALHNRTAMLVDIGGGSIELSLVRGHKMLWVTSVQLGTVRLLKMAQKRKYSRAQLEKYIQRELKKALSKAKALKKHHVDFCIGTGGNVECLGVIRANYLRKHAMTKLYREELNRIQKKIAQMAIKDRIQKWKLRPDRADVILPASIILEQLMIFLGTELMLIPRVGLRDGLLIQMLRPRPNRVESEL